MWLAIEEGVSLKPLDTAAATWQAHYEKVRERYKLLVLHGPSATGKTALAKSSFGPENTLVVDVQAASVPDMKDYTLGLHQCVVFDETRRATGRAGLAPPPLVLCAAVGGRLSTSAGRRRANLGRRHDGA